MHFCFLDPTQTSCIHNGNLVSACEIGNAAKFPPGAIRQESNVPSARFYPNFNRLCVCLFFCHSVSDLSGSSIAGQNKQTPTFNPPRSVINLACAQPVSLLDHQSFLVGTTHSPTDSFLRVKYSICGRSLSSTAREGIAGFFLSNALSCLVPPDLGCLQPHLLPSSFLPTPARQISTSPFRHCSSPFSLLLLLPLTT